MFAFLIPQTPQVYIICSSQSGKQRQPKKCQSRNNLRYVLVPFVIKFYSNFGLRYLQNAPPEQFDIKMNHLGWWVTRLACLRLAWHDLLSSSPGFSLCCRISFSQPRLQQIDSNDIRSVLIRWVTEQERWTWKEWSAVPDGTGFEFWCGKHSNKSWELFIRGACIYIWFPLLKFCFFRLPLTEKNWE